MAMTRLNSHQITGFKIIHRYPGDIRFKVRLKNGTWFPSGDVTLNIYQIDDEAKERLMAEVEKEDGHGSKDHQS